MRVPARLPRLMRLAAVLVTATLLGAPLAPPATAAAPPLPDTMASLGDSITRGFNACGWYSDCTSRSFSTGTDTGVNSHYLRLRAKTTAIAHRNYNDAKTGARMSALNGQAASAVTQQADYVTVLLGANDACTSSESTMTPVTTFDAQLRQGLATLKAGRPDAVVLIASIPDIKRLWEVGKGSSSARTAWSLFGVCQSMLARPTSTQQADVDRRNRVQARVIAYNGALAAACVDYGINCKYDGGAVFSYPFALSQVSTWDYFHPNAAGQRVLADRTWAAGFGW